MVFARVLNKNETSVYGGWENEDRKMRMEKHSVMKIANRNKRIKNNKVKFLFAELRQVIGRRTARWKAAEGNLSFVYSQERMS